MFVPPYQLLLDELRAAASRPRTADDVTLPKAVFNPMLRLLVGKMPFDEAQYLRRNVDISGKRRGGDTSQFDWLRGAFVDQDGWRRRRLTRCF